MQIKYKCLVNSDAKWAFDSLFSSLLDIYRLFASSALSVTF